MWVVRVLFKVGLVAGFFSPLGSISSSRAVPPQNQISPWGGTMAESWHSLLAVQEIYLKIVHPAVLPKMGLPSSVRKTERWSDLCQFCISMILFYFKWWSCCFAICDLSGQTKAGANISKRVAAQGLASVISLQVKFEELAILTHW